jgi:glucose-1-phosphate adenylyltransferase
VFGTNGGVLEKERGAWIMQNSTLTVILAGGHGSRLQPLTLDRAKPAVPFGGKYRIIDFTLVNCLHSNLRRILVLTQYKSHSLYKHLRDGWSLFNPELGEYITAVPPQMRRGENWYGGTADAVYQNLYMIQRSGAERVLILSGDHIYRMDYAAMLTAHEETGAAVTVGCMDVSLEEARQFGVMSVDAAGQITRFEEKPEQPQPIPGDEERALASMGIYVFSMDLLVSVLEEDSQRQDSKHDFGMDIIPRLVQESRVYAYRFGGESGRVSQDRYWRDVGTLDSYYEANMGLLDPVPSLNLYQPEWPIRTYQSQYPPVRTVPGDSGSEGIFINSITAGGVVIAGGSVQHSILFPRVKVGDEAVVHESILFNNVEVGDGARLDRCIVDKDVKIPPGETIGVDREKDAARFTISEKGIVVVPKGYQFE